MRLKQVVLPAPLGPIRAWMVPRRTLQVNVFNGGEPSKFLRQAAGLDDVLSRS